MVRARDRKCRYTFVDKIPKDIFGPQRIPQIKFVDRYLGSSSRRGREAASQPEHETSQTMEQQREREREREFFNTTPLNISLQNKTTIL